MTAFAQALPIPAPPQLAATSYLLMDYDTGTVITEKDPDKRVEPASLTKMMTAYLVLGAIAQQGVKPDDLVFVSRNAHAAIGSRTFLEPESQVTVRDLMYGLVVQSGNDASIALAEHIGGSEEGFVSMMNQVAAQLGMKDTNFANSTGLPHPEHYSTARDLALLASVIIRDYPQHYRLYSVKEFTYNGIRQRNRNTLLLRDPSVDGMKTGHTESAGYCLVASAKRDNMRLISVLLGARNEELRSTESMKALNYGFRFYENVTLGEPGSKLGDVRVWGGVADAIDMGVERGHRLTLQSGQSEQLERSFQIQRGLVAPVSQGQTVGRIDYTLDGKLVAQLPLVALGDVQRGGFFKRSMDSLKRMFSQ
jgi:D-alanyl-D-alanine carboxypeptidase (penicillin-binding protein 5/6)